jgi:hypothetical protein
MMPSTPDLIVLHEHPEWQKPLFAALTCPRSITFNDPRALHAYEVEIRWPALLKPDQGGSGARIQMVEDEND